jgi:hypothetical protein
MGDAPEYARNALRKRKAETRRNVVAKEVRDGMISRAVSGIRSPGEERRKTSASRQRIAHAFGRVFGRNLK